MHTPVIQFITIPLLYYIIYLALRLGVEMKP
jgi:hypothetical protein